MLKFTSKQTGTGVFRDKTVVYDKDRSSNFKVHFLGIKVFERQRDFAFQYSEKLDGGLGFK